MAELSAFGNVTSSFRLPAICGRSTVPNPNFLHALLIVNRSQANEMSALHLVGRLQTIETANSPTIWVMPHFAFTRHGINIARCSAACP
jgi:hypothetical protein